MIMTFPDVLTCETAAVGIDFVAPIALIKASHPCGYAGALSDCLFAKSFYCIARIHKVSHPCG